jgi:putative flippase GtrA
VQFSEWPGLRFMPHGSNGTFLRFVLNGVIATVVHFLVLTFLVKIVQMGSAGIANGVASIFGITASYIGNRILVFRTHRPHLRTFPKFLALYGAVAVLNVLVLAASTDYGNFPYEIGFLIATAASFLLSYFGSRHFVFGLSPK